MVLEKKTVDVGSLLLRLVELGGDDGRVERGRRKQLLLLRERESGREEGVAGEGELERDKRDRER